MGCCIDVYADFNFKLRCFCFCQYLAFLNSNKLYYLPQNKGGGDKNEKMEDNSFFVFLPFAFTRM